MNAIPFVLRRTGGPADVLRFSNQKSRTANVHCTTPGRGWTVTRITHSDDGRVTLSIGCQHDLSADQALDQAKTFVGPGWVVRTRAHGGDLASGPVLSLCAEPSGKWGQVRVLRELA